MNDQRQRRWASTAGLGAMLLAASMSMPTAAQSGPERNAPSGTDRDRANERIQQQQQRQQQMQQRQQRRTVDPSPARNEAEARRQLRERQQQAARSQIYRDGRQSMPSFDRTMMDTLVGYAPPDFTDGLVWHGHDPARGDDSQQVDWLQFRDRIVVVQSWTSANSAGRQAMTDTVDAISEFSTNDVALLLVHTPEGHNGAADHIEHASKSNVSIVVDETGAWCDLVGIHRTPVNFIVDRNGLVQFAGLKAEAIPTAVESIIDAEFDEHAEVQPLPAMERRLNVSFPSARGNTGRTPNIQGQIGPDVFVSEWFNDPPASLRGKTIKVEFWRTNCPHCINAISKLNEMAERFRDDLVIVAITQERADGVRQGLSRRNVDPDGLKYPVGLDPQGRTAGEVGVSGVPHAIVMSSDGVVRWQGHPASLPDQTLEQIILANNAMHARTELERRRWVKN